MATAVLTPRDLLKEPSDEQLQDLGKILGTRWKDVARKMNMQEYEIEDISDRHKHEGIKEKATAMLQSWKNDQETYSATIKSLYDILVDAKCRLAAEKVFGILELQGRRTLSSSSQDMDDRQLYALAQEVGANWSELALSLGISQVDIDKIRCDWGTTDERSYKMLSDWYWEKGSRADFSMVKSKLMDIRSRHKTETQEVKTERSLPRSVNEGYSARARETPSDADVPVSHEQIVSVAEQTSGSWETLAMYLDPSHFSTNCLRAIRKQEQFDVVMQARVMLDQWRDNFPSKATCRALITALCKSGKRSVASNVFGAALVDYVQPQK
jgi:hypothetical protein